MAISKSRQLYLLVMKNYKLQGRKPFFAIVIYLFPIICFGVLMFLRSERGGGPGYSLSYKPTGISHDWSLADTGVLFAPNTTFVNKLMKKFAKITNLQTLGFSTEREMIDALTRKKDYWIPAHRGIVFDNTALSEFTYRLRLKQQKSRPSANFVFSRSKYLVPVEWHTNDNFPPPTKRQGEMPRGLINRDDKLYIYRPSGFLAVQYAVAASLIALRTNKHVELDILIHERPYPIFWRNQSWSFMGKLVSTFFIMSFFMIVIVIVKNIIYEREKRLKEAMVLMGVQSSMYWSAWFIQHMLYFLTMAEIATLMLTVRLGARDDHGVLPFVNPFLMIIFLLSYAVSLISFCFLLSAFIKRENKASLVSLGVFVITTIPWYAYLRTSEDKLSALARLACCLDMNIACFTGFYIIRLLNGIHPGMTWSTFNTPVFGVSLLHVVLMLIFDGLLYLTIFWYVANVWPGEFGIPQPFNFPFLKRYWFGDKAIQHEVGDESLHVNQSCFEKAPSTLKPGVVISHLRKQYGSVVAVADMSLTMYYDQITALVGHNGAGKTTTMLMLSGFIPPTSGTAVVNGYDIKRDIVSVRESLGICPQYDVLFDDMTVREHLIFYTQLKGKPKKESVTDTNEMIELVGLREKEKARAKTLSGGQKRKLSLAIALCGGSKVIVLDEPSSGMDPSARRELWDVLRKMTPGRAIILSTHFMDEADVLGDRIAILGNGVVKCCGSPLFLKHLYGTGYHLTIVKGHSFKRKETKSLICHHIPNADIYQEAGVDIIFKLPRTHIEKFEALFRELEESKHELNMDNFGLSEITMDDVFFMVGEDIDVELPKNASLVSMHVSQATSRTSVKATANVPDTVSTITTPSRPINDVDDTHATDNLIKFNEGLVKITGPKLALQQFYSLLMKKAIYSKRNIITIIISQFIAPIIITSLILWVLKYLQDDHVPDAVTVHVAKQYGDVPLTLNLNNYRESFVPLSVNDTSSSYAEKFSKNYRSLFAKTQAVVETTENVTDYYITQSENRGTRIYKQEYMIGVEISTVSNENITDGIRQMVVHYSMEGYHFVAISMAYALNAWVNTELGSSYNIHCINHPLDVQHGGRFRGKREAESGSTDEPEERLPVPDDVYMSIPVSVSMLLIMTVALAIFVIFIIKERISRSKHVQISSGSSPLMYWFSHFIWDILVCGAIAFAITVLFEIFDSEVFTVERRLGIVFLVLMAYSFATLPFVYLSSFLFSTGGGAVGILIVYSFVSGVLSTVVQIVLYFSRRETGDTIAETLEDIFSVVSPPFCLMKCFIHIYYIHTNVRPPCVSKKYVCSDGDSDICCIADLSMRIPGIGKFIVCMFGQSVVFMVLTLIMEYGLMAKLCATLCGSISSDLRSNEEFEDSDVVNERTRINNNKSTLVKENTLVIDKISKVFGRLLAVEQISIAIPTNQCFGLLGVNGAGKTTAFKMLMGEILMTEGDAFVNGVSVQKQIMGVQKDIGYCPQYDPLIGQMTCRETLFMCARLRGIVSAIIPRVVEDLMASLLLTQYADKRCSKLSGGNRRRLSTAMALIGDPSIVFLDEPTTGMDPVARRRVWNVLSQVRSTGRTLIFTSHSMEECDALCDRMAIMVNGVFRCLGSSQHLKSKFGEGYILQVKIASPSETELPDLSPIINKIEQEFPKHKQLSVNNNFAHYQLTDSALSLADIFGIMEKARGPFNIEDYSVTQTTLDQIFINFAKAQRNSHKTSVGCCKRCCLTCID